MRDRVESGKKTAQTNMKKRADYYSWIARLWGVKRRNVKYNSDLSSDRTLAQSETIEYIVTALDNDGTHKSITRDTREKARDARRAYRNAGFPKVIIRQVHYNGDFIVEDRIVR